MTRAPLPRFDASIAGRVRLACVAAGPLRIGEHDPAITAALEALARELRARHAGKAPAEIDALQPARRLYRSFGIDPTRHRPSSESLLRRILRGRPFPRINDAVDVGNGCSVDALLPLGLYDAERIAGPATLRVGRDGEGYEGIRKGTVHLAGRPVLADALGPFGNPTSDSARTRVGSTCRSVWLVFFAPPDYSETALAAHAAAAADRLAAHLGGAETVRTAWSLSPGPEG